MTPLHITALCGHIGVVERLLENGALIDNIDDCNNTALHYAAVRGHTGVVELLLEEGAFIDAQNVGNDTPLQLAAWDFPNTAQLLQRKGAREVHIWQLW